MITRIYILGGDMVKNSIEAREEIESIVKKSAIDRKRFFEVDKLSYQAVQNRVVAKFSEFYILLY